MNRGEHVEDVMAVAVPVHVHGEVCAIGVAGPIQRLDTRIEKHLKALRALLGVLEKS